jgi:hypothetical protein
MQSFEALHKVSLSGLAVEFVRRSPDAAMRESLKLAGA